MEVCQLTTPAHLEQYDLWVKTHPHGSLWQSLEWKQYQEALGREVRIYAQMADEVIIASAMVTMDSGAYGLQTWEIGRGPLAAVSGERLAVSNDLQVGTNALLSTILQEAKAARALCLYVAPAEEIATSYQLPATPSPRHVYPEATRVLDLNQPEEALLAQMHQKGRYNIRLAEKNGVRVEHSQDMDAYHELACATAKRDGFRTPSKKQFQAFVDTLPGSFLLLAYQGDKNDSRPIAGLLGVSWGGIGIYYYGASSYEHRALMAPYLLQWRAMQHCQAQGCLKYDLLGVTPPHTTHAHAWDGISSFKEKFGGTVASYPPEQMVVLRPWAYRALQWKRKVLG